MLQENISKRDRLEKLFEIVRRKRKILILTHNNPDPDAHWLSNIFSAPDVMLHPSLHTEVLWEGRKTRP
jgi:hypothetical protein